MKIIRLSRFDKSTFFATNEEYKGNHRNEASLKKENTCKGTHFSSNKSSKHDDEKF